MLPKKRKPTHLGVVLHEEFMVPMNLSPKELAQKLGDHWSEIKVNAIINGKEEISDKIAHDLATFFGISPDFWLRLQKQVHAWDSLQKEHEKGTIKPWKKAQNLG